MVLQSIACEHYRDSSFVSYYFSSINEITPLEKTYENLFGDIYPHNDIGVKCRYYQYNAAQYGGRLPLPFDGEDLDDAASIQILVTHSHLIVRSIPLDFDKAFKNRYSCWVCRPNIAHDLIVRSDPRAKAPHTTYPNYLSDVLGTEGSITNPLSKVISSVNIRVMCMVVYYDAELDVTHKLSVDGTKVITHFGKRTPDGTTVKVKVEYKIGRWVSRYLLCPTYNGCYDLDLDKWFTNHDSWVETITNMIKGWHIAHGDQTHNIQIEEETGTDIWLAYNVDRYMTKDQSYDYGIDLGDLHDSCMRHYECRDYIEGWYGRALGPDIVKCLVLKVDGYVVARGLLWNVEGEGWMLDRVYGGDAANKMLLAWCKERGISSCKYKEGYTLAMDLEARARVKDYFLSGDGDFPYCDTFYCVYYNEDGCIVMSSSRTQGTSALKSAAGSYYKLCALQDTEGLVVWAKGSGAQLWGKVRYQLSGSSNNGGTAEDDDDDYDE